MPTPQAKLVAVDTNVLLRLAGGDETTSDACALIRHRLKPVQFVIPPTVMEELGAKASEHWDPASAALASRAIALTRGRFDGFAADLNSAEEFVVENAARELVWAGLIPEVEPNDARILVEAAVLNCILLVSRDSHLIGIDRDKLSILFHRLDLPVPIIASPHDLIRRF